MIRNLLSMTLALAITGSIQGVTNQETTVKIALIGDSTVTDAAGWGKAFAGRFDGNVNVINYAVGGRSSKSWYYEKRLPAVLDTKPYYVLIQFGHNDQPGKGPQRETDPATTYRDYLKIYINQFRAIGAKPIIVSSVTRRTFDKNNRIASSLTPFAEAAKAVAKEMDVPFIDLHTLSVEHHNAIGPEASMTYNPKADDMTHFNKKGAEAITDLIIHELKAVVQDLNTYIKKPTSEGTKYDK
ncbi:MAG: rhamnogalacturonan acetylesterase [bacterium]